MSTRLALLFKSISKLNKALNQKTATAKRKKKKEGENTIKVGKNQQETLFVSTCMRKKTSIWLTS